MEATPAEAVETLPSIEVVFARSWELYLRRLPEVMLVGAAGGIATFVSVAVPLAAVWLWKGLEAGAAAWGAATLIGASAALWFVSWLQAATLRCFLDERPAKTLDRYRETAAQVGPFSWVCVLSFVFIMGGIWALVVPGCYLMLGLLFAPWVQLAEGRGGLAALERSLELARGRWWSLAGRLALVALATSAPSLVPIAGPLLGAAAAPFGLAAATVLYRDLAAARPSAAAASSWRGRVLLGLAAAGLLLPLKASIELARHWPELQSDLASQTRGVLSRPLDPGLARRLVESLTAGGLNRESTSLLFELAVSTQARQGP